MASVLYYNLNSRSKLLGHEYLSLLEEFRKSGEYDIFGELFNDLLKLQDQAYNLSDPEERLEIINAVTVLRNSINALLHSAY